MPKEWEEAGNSCATPGKQPGHSQVGHIWKSKLSLLLFPLRWTVLAWLFVNTILAVAFKSHVFFPCDCFSKVSSGDGKKY